MDPGDVLVNPGDECNWKIGEKILVRYVDDEPLHERVLCSCVVDWEWVILTPDGDVYVEDYSDQNHDIVQVKEFGPRGGLPRGGPR